MKSRTIHDYEDEILGALSPYEGTDGYSVRILALLETTVPEKYRDAVALSIFDSIDLSDCIIGSIEVADDVLAVACRVHDGYRVFLGSDLPRTLESIDRPRAREIVATAEQRGRKSLPAAVASAIFGNILPADVPFLD